MPVTAIRSRVHVGPADQVVDAADAVEALDARRRVAARMPPPAALAVRAVMNRGDLAQLQRVDHQADVAVPGEPDAVRLIGGLVAVAAAAGVSADVEHGRQPLPGLHLRRPIEVARDVQPRPALVVEHVDHEAVALERPGDGGLQRRLLRLGAQAQHVEVLLLVPVANTLPVLQRRVVLRKRLVNLVRLLLEILLDHLIAGLAPVRRIMHLREPRRDTHTRHSRQQNHHVH